MFKLRLLILFVAYCNVAVCCAATVFYTKGSDNKNDQRYQYIHQTLHLALSKTADEYGSYELKRIPHTATIARLLKQLQQKDYNNFFLKMSITDDILQKYHVIPFPLDRGMAGYRVSFVNVNNKNKLCGDNIETALKSQTIIQGIGWLDGDILNYNGYITNRVTYYQSMFKMIDKGRAELFPRGVYEIYKETNNIVKNYTNIVLEPCFAFYYPLPRFFITSKDNAENAKRIEKGLAMAFEDGSLIKLWEEYFSKSIAMTQLHKRKIIVLENPFIKTLDKTYQKYNVKVNVD